MRTQIKKFRDTWRKDYQFSTLVSISLVPLSINTAFTLYNGIERLSFFWNGSICIYYLFPPSSGMICSHTAKKNNRKIYCRNNIMLLGHGYFLIAPFAVMEKHPKLYVSVDSRQSQWRHIPNTAIIIEAFISAIQEKCRHFDFGTRTINLTDAMIAVLSFKMH